MANTAQHLAARRDLDLRDRLVATAETAGVKNARDWVEENIGALITAKISGDTTIADVHASADVAYRAALAAIVQPERPGANLAAVIDDYLSAAVGDVLS